MKDRGYRAKTAALEHLRSFQSLLNSSQSILGPFQWPLNSSQSVLNSFQSALKAFQSVILPFQSALKCFHSVILPSQSVIPPFHLPLNAFTKSRFRTAKSRFRAAKSRLSARQRQLLDRRRLVEQKLGRNNTALFRPMFGMARSLPLASRQFKRDCKPVYRRIRNS